MAPQTVSNFVGAVEAGAYSGTMFNKVLPGQFVAAGRCGKEEAGQCANPARAPCALHVVPGRRWGQADSQSRGLGAAAVQWQGTSHLFGCRLPSNTGPLVL